jgi:hypothetical protein
VKNQPSNPCRWAVADGGNRPGSARSHMLGFFSEVE